MTISLSGIDKTFVSESKIESTLSGLIKVCNEPKLGGKEEIKPLSKSSSNLKSWLEKKINVEIYLSEIEKQVKIELSRYQYIKFCGNMSKHSLGRLGNVANDIRKIFKSNNIEIDIQEVFKSRENILDRFRADIFLYQSSTIVEMLLEIRWSIAEYLKPVLTRQIRYKPKDWMPNFYQFDIPQEIEDKLIRYLFWELMSDVKVRKNFFRIKVDEILKRRY